MCTCGHLYVCEFSCHRCARCVWHCGVKPCRVGDVARVRHSSRAARRRRVHTWDHVVLRTQGSGRGGGGCLFWRRNGCTHYHGGLLVEDSGACVRWRMPPMSLGLGEEEGRGVTNLPCPSLPSPPSPPSQPPSLLSSPPSSPPSVGKEGKGVRANPTPKQVSSLGGGLLPLPPPSPPPTSPSHFFIFLFFLFLIFPFFEQGYLPSSHRPQPDWLAAKFSAAQSARVGSLASFCETLDRGHNSTRRPPKEREHQTNFAAGEGKKQSDMLGPLPSNNHPSGPHLFGPPIFSFFSVSSLVYFKCICF